MGQGTMTLREAAEVEKVALQEIAREAHEGRMRLHPQPACKDCGVPEGEPCEPACGNAGAQVVWIGDWFAWRTSAASPRKDRTDG